MSEIKKTSWSVERVDRSPETSMDDLKPGEFAQLYKNYHVIMKISRWTYWDYAVGLIEYDDMLPPAKVLRLLPGTRITLRAEYDPNHQHDYKLKQDTTGPSYWQCDCGELKQ